VATVGLLAAGIALSLLKGFDYEEALILGSSWPPCCPRAVTSTAFRRCRALRRACMVAAVLAIVAGTAWLTLFSHKHVDVSQELWWQFTLHGDAPRSLRALTGVVIALVPRPPGCCCGRGPDVGRCPPVDLQKVESLVRACPRSLSSLALLGDKRFLFSPEGDAFVMYGIAGAYISMGDPVGPSERWRELVWQLRELADRHGAGVAFYEVEAASLPLYLDLGLTAVKIGEEARVGLADFSLEGSSRKGLRYAVNAAGRDGCSFEVVPREGPRASSASSSRYRAPGLPASGQGKRGSPSAHSAGTTWPGLRSEW